VASSRLCTTVAHGASRTFSPCQAPSTAHREAVNHATGGVSCPPTAPARIRRRSGSTVDGTLGGRGVPGTGGKKGQKSPHAIRRRREERVGRSTGPRRSQRSCRRSLARSASPPRGGRGQPSERPGPRPHADARSGVADDDPATARYTPAPERGRCDSDPLDARPGRVGPTCTRAPANREPRAVAGRAVRVQHLLLSCRRMPVEAGPRMVRGTCSRSGPQRLGQPGPPGNGVEHPISGLLVLPWERAKRNASSATKGLRCSIRLLAIFRACPAPRPPKWKGRCGLAKVSSHGRTRPR